MKIEKVYQKEGDKIRCSVCERDSLFLLPVVWCG